MHDKGNKIRVGSVKRNVEDERKAINKGIVCSGKAMCGGGGRRDSKWWNEEERQLIKKTK